jgi:ribosomal 50S subunit-associated protein YjgA (DUF615 family)
MSGAIHPLPQYAFMAWCLVKAQGQLYLYLFTNEEVLCRIGTEQQLIRTIKRRKVSYFGHIVRHENYAPLQCILEDKIDGKKPEVEGRHPG